MIDVRDSKLFLGHKTTDHQRNNWSIGFSQFHSKNCYSWKDTTNRIKQRAIDQKKISTMYVSDKGLVSLMYKEHN